MDEEYEFHVEDRDMYDTTFVIEDQYNNTNDTNE